MEDGRCPYFFGMRVSARNPSNKRYTNTCICMKHFTFDSSETCNTGVMHDKSTFISYYEDLVTNKYHKYQSQAIKIVEICWLLTGGVY